MFAGAQVSLYPMTDGLVDVILGSLSALDPWRDRLRIETDDISTLIVRPPEVLFPALRDLYTTASRTGEHVALRATFSRGCPGQSDDPIFQTNALANPAEPLAERQASALSALVQAPETDAPAATQFSLLYVMGAGDHTAEIMGCIDFLKDSGTFDRSKNFCTRLKGDGGAVFATLEEAFCRFGPPEGQVTTDLTVSTNSSSTR